MPSCCALTHVRRLCSSTSVFFTQIRFMDFATFDCVLDTPARQKQIKFAFALDLFVSLHCYESIVQQYPDMVSSLHIGDVHNRHGVYTYRAVF